MDKRFKLLPEQIHAIAEGRGSCIASDMITVDGNRVGWMYREEPDNPIDSGWRFFSGLESQDYADDSSKFAIYDVNTIANYDPEIVSYLDAPVGSAFERDPNGEFVEAEQPN